MPRPLDTFPLVRTSDLDQLRSVLGTLFQDSVFDIGSDRNSAANCINYCPLQHTGLMYGNFGAAIRASFGEMQFYVQGVTVSGTGEQLTNGKTTSANVGGLLSPRANLRLHFDAGFEHLALNIEADALARKLGAIIGSPPSKPILFEVDPEFGHPAVLRLRRMIEFLVEELSSGRRDIPIVAMVEMEQALMTWFLVGNRNNYSPLLNGRSQSAAPWQVKRAEEYIEASWDQPLTIEVLAAVTGSSARSLFHALLAHDVSQASAPAACVVSAQMLEIPRYRSRTSLTPADLAISAISPSIFAPSSVKLPPRSCPGLRTACESLFENALRQLALIE